MVMEIAVTGSVQVLEEAATDVVEVVAVQAIAVLGAAAPHEARLNSAIANASQIRGLTTHRPVRPELFPGNNAIVWLNLDPTRRNAKLCRTPSGRKAASKNPHFSPTVPHRHVS
jgi:hypothetical protein